MTDAPAAVIPAKAGIHADRSLTGGDRGFRRDDE